MTGTAETIDVELLRMRTEAYARRYAALASDYEQIVRRVRRVLELLDPQGLLVPALQPNGGGSGGNGILVGLDLLIERLEGLADPSGLLVTVPKPGLQEKPEALEVLNEVQQEFIRQVGAGEILLTNIAERMGIPRARAHELSSQMQRAGWIDGADVSIPLGPAARQAGVAGRVRAVRLTESGKQVYCALFGEKPVDAWAELIARYKSLEAAFLIRGVADLIHGLNSLEERSFDFQVVDPAVATEDEIAAIGGQREYRDGDVSVQPDLLVLMRPRRGSDVLIAVEVEFGNYSRVRLQDKWRRALLCYPVPLYVVATSAATRDRLFREMEVVRKQMLSSGHVFDRWVRYVFYTLDEIARNGLLSPAQITRFEVARKAGESGIPPLPRYFFQKPMRGGDE